MRKESFETALPHIREYFDSAPERAFTLNDIQSIFNGNREEW